MLDFFLRRLAAALLTLGLASVVVFSVLEVLPGDPALVMLGTEARPDTLAALRAKMGFDRPAPERYATWIAGLATFDLGNSQAYGTPVSKLILDRLAVTLPLGAMALAFSLCVAIPLGVFAASRRGRASDWLVMGFGQLGISIPNFWFGILLALFFAVSLKLFPAGGFPGWAADPLGSLHALVLPALSLSLPEIAILSRVTRS
jgi:peptide/nickel transport system permease protein